MDSEKKVKLSASSISAIVGSLAVLAAAVAAFATRSNIKVPDDLKKRLSRGNVKKS